MDSVNLEAKNVITGRDVEKAARSGAKKVTVRSGVVITTAARDAAAAAGLEIARTGGGQPAQGGAGGFTGAERVFNSSAARAIKEEIVAVGRKLWLRNYVDGNGGNISCRLSDEYILCTPTLVSKGDLTPDDICLVDMNGNQVAGKRRSTSELKLHIEIFKAQPKARACVHAHPPYATAYSIVGKVPPLCVIPEAEIFIGMVALASYETPGTREVAEKIIPLVADHNTILLANHGIITWADSVTHAEWFVEVVDNYCRTLTIAKQLGAPITRISTSQSAELMEIKRKLDLPDPRISGREAMLCDVPDASASITVTPRADGCGGCQREGGCTGCPTVSEIESVVREITDRVMKALGPGGKG